jgi:hypothetical protein
LVDQDPQIKQYYQNFLTSLSPEQKARLDKDYDYAVKHEGETTPREDWKAKVRLPAILRGYAFKQWPESFTHQILTKEQRANLDAMMQYLRSPAGGGQ